MLHSKRGESQMQARTPQEEQVNLGSSALSPGFEFSGRLGDQLHQFRFTERFFDKTIHACAVA